MLGALLTFGLPTNQFQSPVGITQKDLFEEDLAGGLTGLLDLGAEGGKEITLGLTR